MIKRFFSYLQSLFFKKETPYHLPWHQLVFQDPEKLLVDFQCKHHYFSSHPLIGRVSTNKSDLEIVKDLMLSMHEKITSPIERIFTSNEILAKVLAYRDLKKGDKFLVPLVSKYGRPILSSFYVDRIFNLWNGMPAFGLISKDAHISPIFLYRGTDLTLDTKRGWSSILSDLDFAGPGLNTYLHARSDIRKWLVKVKKHFSKARVMGFSLGGVLTSYTLLYEHDLIEKSEESPSMAFSPPGVSKKVFLEWVSLPEKDKSPFMVFITTGDLVSKIGRLYGDVYQVTPNPSLSAIAAHASLVTALPYISMKNISDVKK